MVFDNRKIYFIKKDFQTRFILRFVAIATAWAAVTVMLFAYLAEKKLERLRFSSHINITTTSELLMPITLGAHVVSLLIFAGILAYTIHALWKRLSPPLYDIKKDIARIAGGELASEVTLRENDEFQDLAADLDMMRRELREKIIRINEQQRVLSNAVAELSGSIIKGNPSLADAASLRSAVARMKEDLQAFHY
jgi:methyl-accepting chemotaxis protein